MEEDELTNAMNNLILIDLKMLKDSNPELCHKVTRLFADVTKWERDHFTYDEAVEIKNFIDKFRNETDKSKFENYKFH